MKIKFDKEANAIYIKFKEGKIAESDEIKDGVIIDYDSEGNPLAIEILNAKNIIKGKPEIIGDFSSIMK